MMRYTEKQLTRKLRMAGYVLCKARAGLVTAKDMDGYAVIDTGSTNAVLGPHFEATLDDVRSWAQSMGVLDKGKGKTAARVNPLRRQTDGNAAQGYTYGRRVAFPRSRKGALFK
ncbi:MAG: hypothetical protein IKN81_10460 [Oscillospiraceae bacterium]|nr:hypothetical protein [Oscillospiraceae bacterium]